MNYLKVVSTIESPSQEHLLPTLACPVCEYHNTHVQAVYTLLGEDESGGLYRGSYLVARETPFRRDALAVRVTGECGHRWDLVFQQHKGETLVRIDVLESEHGEELQLERL
jgi:hypothetical protein